MGSGLARIDAIKLESSSGSHIQICRDPEGTVPKKVSYPTSARINAK